MPPDPVQKWLEKAVEDEEASNLLDVTGELWSVAAFHLQQSAEKMLKALVVHRGGLPPRTHELGTLILMIKEPRAGQALLDAAARLSPHSWQTRYPGIEPLTKSEFEHARADFLAIKSWVEPLIGDVPRAKGQNLPQ